MTALGRGASPGASRAVAIGAGIVTVGAIGLALHLAGGVPAARTPNADALRRDLDAAAAAAAFAPTARAGAPVRFVSPLELGESTAPARSAPAGSARAVRPVPAAARHAAHAVRSTPTAVAVEHAPVRDVADRTSAATTAPAAVAAPAGPVGDAAPPPGAHETGPAVAAAGAPASAGGGTYTPPTAPGPSVASAPPSPAPEGGGVVIRGGGIGDTDHCERDHGRGRMPWPGGIFGGGSIGRRFPGRF